MDSSFWWGLAVAIPLGILTNLVTPFVQRQIAARSSVARERQERRREAETELAVDLANDGGYFNSWLMCQHARHVRYSVVFTTFIVALSIAAGVMTLSSSMPRNALPFNAPVLVLIVMFVMITTATAWGVALVSDIRKVNNIVYEVSFIRGWKL